MNFFFFLWFFNIILNHLINHTFFQGSRISIFESEDSVENLHIKQNNKDSLIYSWEHDGG
jgi:hypothetical protein